MKGPVALLLIFLLGLGSALDCSAPVDVVIAVPGSPESVPEEEFRRLEDFLHGVVSYYDVAADKANVGLVLYGREPVVISDLTDATSRESINARITLLSQRSSVLNQISGGQNVPKAIVKVQEVLATGRDDVPKIGIVMTYGSEDLTSPNAQVVRAQVDSVSKEALDAGIALFATSSGGAVPGFSNITGNFCRLFSLGSFLHLETLLPYLASATCYVLDKNVTATAGKCFPELQPRPTTEVYQCAPTDSDVQDPQNCAYWYRCPEQLRQSCPPGLLFDPSLKRCNHKEFTTCYNGFPCPAEGGTFPFPGDCTKFFFCHQRVPYVFDCAPGTRYSPKMKFCFYSDLVQCDL